MPTCKSRGNMAPSNNISHNKATATANAIANMFREYKPGLSKQIMKLNKYSANGSTHRKGITATSWQILLVMARRRTEAQAGRRSQRRVVERGAWSGIFV